MLNFGSCDSAQSGLDRLAGDRAESLKERLSGALEGLRDPEALERLERDFTSLLYSILLRQMQRTVPSEEGAGVLAEGVRDFLQLHLPGVLAEQQNDPLREYVRAMLGTECGENVDERA